MWNHFVTRSDDRLTKLVFMWDLENSKKQNWSHHVKLLLHSIDMSTYLLNREVCNLNLAEIKLQQKFVNDWQNELQSVSKLRTYRSFKSDFNLEKYVTMDMPKPHRSILAQFRCGVFSIRIETGRIRGEEVNDRLCIRCSVEHILLHCTSYSKLRTEFFTSIGFNNRLLNMSDSDCTGFLLSNFPRQTAKLVYSAFMCRQSILYKNNNA